MTNTTDGGTISLQTMRAWKSELEQLGAAGDLDLLRQVAEQRQRQEEGDATNHLSPEQIGMIEGLTGIKVEFAAPSCNPDPTVDRPEQDVLALDPEDYQPTPPPSGRPTS